MDTMLRGLGYRKKAKGRAAKERNKFFAICGTSPVNPKEFPAFLLS